MLKNIPIHAFILSIVTFLLLINSSVLADKSKQSSVEKKTRTLVNLLDYIGKDYPKAVTKGRVINDYEYKEMKEFHEESRHLYTELTASENISDTSETLALFADLRDKIEAKAPTEEVASIADQIAKEVLSLELIAMAPKKWPDLSAGRKIYNQKCASCHGKNGKGNGPAAEGLEPAPTNFQNEELMALSSPFKSYNVAKLGIPETSMRAFDELSDKEVWDVAFYINSLQFREENEEHKITKKQREVLQEIPLSHYATYTNEELREEYVTDKKHDISLADLRLYQPKEKEKEHKSTLAVSKEKLNEALSLYRNDKKDRAADAALKAYLDGVEPVEQQIKASEPALVGRLENDMMAVRKLIKNEEDTDKVEAAVTKAQATIQEAATILEEEEYSFWFVLFMSGSIILREGLEALLIIVAILSVLRSVEAHYARKWVHSGWTTAIGLGLISWFFADYLVNMGMRSIELIEGIGALIAVVILVYIGFWLHSKTHAANWKAFIDDKVKAKLNSNNMLGLAVVSFIVVFREAFETVLFLTSLNLEVTQANKSGIGIGVGGAGIIVLILGWVFMRFTKNLPISKIFKFTSIAISVLAVILTGKGIHAFQESGLIPISSAIFDFRLSLIGFYPTIETIAAQLLVIGFVIFLWNWSNRAAKAAS